MLKINNNKIYFIAEISSNHGKSKKKLFNIIDKAKEAKASAIKIQTYTADTITLNSNKKYFTVNSSKTWGEKNLYKLYKKASTPWSWHKEIFEYCKKINIDCFSSPFDESAVDLLESVGCQFYKIASFEINHYPLLVRIAKTKKPVILSTGMATYFEISNAIKTLKKNGCPKIILLKCTSNYPAKPKDSNLLTIPDMRKNFKCHVGLSDHTVGIGVALNAISKGARIIEKHIKLNNKSNTIDSFFSLTSTEFANMVDNANYFLESNGSIKYGATKNEKKSLKYRRSIFVSADVKKGDVITSSNIKVVRPNHGLDPKFYYKILGKKFTKNLQKGIPIQKKYVK